mmetsp:Transcript_7246/g.15701  ORF Transcript_7246/g.15701 Transcript_7246/m.15701 type:complete len:251 (-) Transcript_7246:440-1192(-)
MTTKTATSRPNILLGVTGSVAAVKSPEIALRLREDLNADVRVLLTAGGANFWEKAAEYNGGRCWRDFWSVATARRDERDGYLSEKSTLDGPARIVVYSSTDEWAGWNRLGDPVLHVDLRDWADFLVVAPLSAHTLAKFSGGFCDDPLSCTFRAWDFGHGTRPLKPILLAPAMNTAMWIHPLTGRQLQKVKDFPAQKQEFGKSLNSCPKLGLEVVEPQVKTLACGEVGLGALADVDEIINAAKRISLNFKS